MSFKEVASLDASTTIALGGKNEKTSKANPTAVTGHYLGYRTVTTEYGPAKLHVFSTDKGNVGVWGKTNMNTKLEGVEPGQLVRVSFTGMQKVPGRRDMYKYKVEVDTENTIDVGGLAAATEEETQDDGSEPNEEYTNEDFDPNDDSLDESDVEDESEELDTPPPARATAPKKAAPVPTADRQAKVKALLNKGRATA